MRKRFDLSVTTRSPVSAVATFCRCTRVFAPVDSTQGARPRTSCVLAGCSLTRCTSITDRAISTGAAPTTVTTCTAAAGRD
jgi:hypothetical protein